MDRTQPDDRPVRADGGRDVEPAHLDAGGFGEPDELERDDRAHAVPEQHDRRRMLLARKTDELADIGDQCIPSAGSEIAETLRPGRGAMAALIRRPDREACGVQRARKAGITQRVLRGLRNGRLPRRSAPRCQASG